ncbi:homeobox and c2h2 transcription factor [Colletotrichum musicola]|uniref:Homeobox and c2h2 transcription factor n=1 Tax=Colletotrichum musicola TaxID=2175873 RepID=A0A8H6K470_9PEZI|nr:homeobox and c2h2 transcription factor [Colletotrichum musicola]
MDDDSAKSNDTNAGAVDYSAELEFSLLTANFPTSSSLQFLENAKDDALLQEIQSMDAAGLLDATGDELKNGDELMTDPGLSGLLEAENSLFEPHPLTTSREESAGSSLSGTPSNGEPPSYFLGSMESCTAIEDGQILSLAAPPKIGTRFSSKSLRILKMWLSNNSQHPYPTTLDMELLERQTGLSKQQISNWLSNTRRRSKFKAPPKRPPSPAITSATSQPIKIGKGSRLPTGFEHMDPMQRWQVSPPEHEPASVSAIAHAVSDFPPGAQNVFDRSSTESAPRSLYTGSSASSAGTSQSSRSSANSAYSHNSRTSLRLLDPLGKSAMKRRRRRGLAQRQETKGSNTLWLAQQMYQCTFCTETFKTKHNWQRHEKSMHLSLERWECSPSGPTIPDASGRPVCVFCGEGNPDADHMEGHDYSVCKTRDPEDRTFYRKDHLQQHLKLVHDSKFLKWPMNDWKRENSMVRSRCGFCGLIMGSWNDRADHLAEHFKDGKTMQEWHGDWGFDDHVLKMVENSVAPYMIHMERYSPWPFTTTQGVPETMPNAFELLKIEVDRFCVDSSSTKGRMPTNAELLYESCCVIFGSEIMSLSTATRPATSVHSWLRDLLMSSEVIVKRARTRPLKTARKSRATYLCINGKANIFEECSFEQQLQNYVDISKLLEPEVTDEELQREACSIIQTAELSSTKPSEAFSGFLIGLINASTRWLEPFRQRAGLPPTEHSDAPTLDIGNQDFLSAALPDLKVGHRGDDSSPEDPWHQDADAMGDSHVESTAKPGKATTFFVNEDNCYRRLALELTRFVKITMSEHNPNRHVPSDAELQHQARWISFEDDDPWNQTPADVPEWLREFKREMGILDEQQST